MRLLAPSLAVLASISTLISPSIAKTGPKCVAYIEVNNNPISSVGQYTLADGSNVFDIGIIFAANINWNGSAAVLSNNAQVQNVLNNAATQIKPLQAKGIKVLLSILGNHQGAGISNFPTQAAAAAFASQLTAAVNKYGLDGIDFDDEYADYGTNGTPQTNANSVGWLIAALRSQLGSSKLITFYNYGPASNYLSSGPASTGAMLNYSWNAIYSTYQAPQIPGLGKSSLSPAAIEFGSTSQSDAVSFAKNTVSQGYGAYMTYALTSANTVSYISAFTQALYGQTAKYN